MNVGHKVHRERRRFAIEGSRDAPPIRDVCHPKSAIDRATRRRENAVKLGFDTLAEMPMKRQLRVLKYIELKSGYSDDGPAWIGRVKLSKSGRTVYFNGRALKQGARGPIGNYHDLVSGEDFWVSGIKRDGQDRHLAGTGKVVIEAAAVDEYLSIVGETVLDRSRFVVSHDIADTDPTDFVHLENKSSQS